MPAGKLLSEERVYVGLSTRDLDSLRLMARREEISVSAVVRRIVRTYLQQRDTAPAEVAPEPERAAVAVG